MSDRGMDHDTPAADVPEGEEKWPIGFILTIVMVSAYLVYRLIQGLVLLVDWIF